MTAGMEQTRAAPDSGAPAVVEVATPQDLLLQDVLAYWRGKCPDEDTLPGRAAIDPTEIPRLLPHLYLVDVEQAAALQPVYRLRLIGSVHERLYGGKVQIGRTVDELMGERARYFHCNFDAVRRRRAPVGYRGKLVWWPDRDWLDFESIQMPLAGDGRNIDMILGATVFSILGRKWGG